MSTISMADLSNSPVGLSATAMRLPSGDQAGPFSEKRGGLFKTSRVCSSLPSEFATTRLEVLFLLDWRTKTKRFPLGEKLMGLSTSAITWRGAPPREGA